VPFDRAREALRHIAENIALARSFVEGVDFEGFKADKMRQYAVLRSLEVISEASRRLAPGVRDRHPDIPWQRIAAAGNVYRHEYDRIGMDIVWVTVERDLPSLLAAVEAELAREA
jgi:uncharacterized protein with HEPN domain